MWHTKTYTATKWRHMASDHVVANARKLHNKQAREVGSHLVAGARSQKICVSLDL